MKFQINIAFVLLLVGCDQQSVTINNQKITQPDTLVERLNLKSTDPKAFLPGSWKLSYFDQKAQRYSSRTDLELVFGENSEGSIFEKGRLAATFSWNINLDTMELKVIPKEIRPTKIFLDSIFLFQKTRDSISTQLTVTRVNHRIAFKLSTLNKFVTHPLYD